MKRSKMKVHLERVHPDMKNKDVEFFKVLKEKIRNQPNLKSFFKAPEIYRGSMIKKFGYPCSKGSIQT
ncbi:hypothetical protein T09_294 [Trichinella sp. T9]|nr:hypothetical protein T09_294 [Trichinella sp. T9]